MDRKIYSSEEIAQKLRTLPQYVQDFIYGNDMGTIIQIIGNRHSLHIDQLAFLETEIVDVLIGTTERENFVAYIENTLEIDLKTAEAIAQDVNELVFVKIRENLKNGTATPSKLEQNSVPSKSQPSTPPPTYAFADTILTQKTSSEEPLPAMTLMPRDPILQKPPQAHILPPPAPLPQTLQKPISISAPIVPALKQEQVSPNLTAQQENSPAPSAPTYKSDPYKESVE